jgi:hypothetical protein
MPCVRLIKISKYSAGDTVDKPTFDTTLIVRALQHKEVLDGVVFDGQIRWPDGVITYSIPVTAQPPRRKPCRARCIDLLDVTTAGLIQD